MLLLNSLILPTSCDVATSTTSVGYAANHGCYDGFYFWIGDYVTSALTKLDYAGHFIHQYDGTVEGFGQIIQIAYDGTYLWIGSDGTNTYPLYSAVLTKFNPSTGHTVKQWNLNPTLLGHGGIQGVLYDGSHVWCGIAQNGGGYSSGLVLGFNPITEQIDVTVTAQLNVNGLAYAVSGGQEYIFAACAGFTSKIDASTGEYTSVTTYPSGARVCSDGTYYYVAAFTDPGMIQKFRISDSSLIGTFYAGAWLNAITYALGDIFVVGDDTNLTRVNPTTGATLCSVAGLGQSDVVFDGYSTLWTVIIGASGNVSHTYFNPTSTPSITQTPTHIPTRTSTFTPTFTVTKTITLTISSTLTPTSTMVFYYTSTKTPIASRTATPTITSTFTITQTATITPTFTITMTPQTTPIYYFSNKDIFYNHEVTINSTDGSYTWVASDYGILTSTALTFAASILYGPYQAADILLTTHNAYAIINIVDIAGAPIDCSSTINNTTIDLYIMRDKKSFPYWP